MADVSVIVAVKERFSGRILEWYVAAQLFMWGMVLLFPITDVFVASPDYFVHFGLTQRGLGWVMLLLGMVRLGALVINGALGHVTPFFRIGGAYIGCGVWFYITVNFAASGHIGVWIAAWPMACLAEFVNMFRASQDARRGIDKARLMKAAVGSGRG